MKQEQKIWLITDTHFSHKKLIEWGRPPDFEDKLWKGLSVIGDDDLLIHLGDFCIGNDAENHARFMETVKCTKIFVRGNHDNKSDSWLYKAGWDFVCREYKNKHFGLHITFSHIPIKRNETSRNVHGHTHGNTHRDIEIQPFYDTSFHIELAPETSNYMPVLLTQKLLNIK